MPHSVHTDRQTEARPAADHIDYWNVNVPSKLWSDTCPDFLRDLTAKNVRLLSTRDADFHRPLWPEVRDIVRTNKLDKFERLPSDLRRYLKYTHDLKHSYGSVLSFVQHERLHWTSVDGTDDPPFTNPSDYVVLYNDWPYGIDPKITHLVVWVKFMLEDDLIKNDLTEKARAQVEDFVVKTFCDQSRGGIPREGVVWFKNWRNLKSVEGLEHFHVMLYQAPKRLLDEVTRGDISMSEKLKE